MSSFPIPEDLGIESAEPLQGALKPRLAEAGVLVLDGSQVHRLHAASLQVLAALFKQRAAAGRQTRIDNPSDELKAAARICGLSALFGWSTH